jgi:hypothetical protein
VSDGAEAPRERRAPQHPDAPPPPLTTQTRAAHAYGNGATMAPAEAPAEAAWQPPKLQPAAAAAAADQADQLHCGHAATFRIRAADTYGNRCDALRSPIEF